MRDRDESSFRFFRADGVDALSHGFDFGFQCPLFFLERFEAIPLRRPSPRTHRVPIAAGAEFIQELTEILKREIVQRIGNPVSLAFVVNESGQF